MVKININLKEILIFVCILIFMYIIYKSITYYKYKNSLNKTLNKNINNDDYDDHTVEPTPPAPKPAVPNCPYGKYGNFSDPSLLVRSCSGVMKPGSKVFGMPQLKQNAKCNQSYIHTDAGAGPNADKAVYNLCKAQLSTDVKSSCNAEMDKLCKDRSSPEKCLECVGKNKGILGTVCDSELVANICAKKMVCSESEECNLVQPPKLGPNKNYCCDLEPASQPDAPPGPPPYTPMGDECGQAGDWSDVGRRVWPIHPKNSCDCKDAFDKANKKDNNIYTAWQYTWDTPPGTDKDTNQQCSLYTGGKGTPSGQKLGSVYGEIPPPPPPSDPAIHKEGKNVCNPGWNKTDCQNIKGCKWYNTVADVCRDAPMPPQLDGNNCCMSKTAVKNGTLCKSSDNKTECESPAPGGAISGCEWKGPTDKCQISGLVPNGQR